MARRPVKNKRLPGEYPIFAFRLSADRKITLNNQILAIQTKFNESRGANEPFWNKNDVIFEVLEIGLKHFMKCLPR